MARLSQCVTSNELVITMAEKLDIRDSNELKEAITAGLLNRTTTVIQLENVKWIDLSVAQVLVAAQRLGVSVRLGNGNSSELTDLLGKIQILQS